MWLSIQESTIPEPKWITIIVSAQLCDTTRLNSCGTGDYITAFSDTFFPFAQFVPYEKDSKPCEELPLCLVFLCCLSQGNWVTRKMWMKHGKRARLVSKESLWRSSRERKATVRRPYMDLGEQSQASDLPLTRESLLERDFLFCRCKCWLSCLCS